MRNLPSRTWSVALALLAGLWSLVLLPLMHLEFSGSGMPGWATDVLDLAPYDALVTATADLDGYFLYGSLAAVSFALLWFATGPVLARLGWSGRVLGALLLAGAPVTVLSYVSWPEDAPLHPIWGAEGLLLIVIGAWGFIIAAVAPRERVPLWERLVVGLTLVVAALATVLLGYWPHGTLVGLSVEFAALAAWAPRADAPDFDDADRAG
ncbi:hypothetical protein [Agromyces seonyuensis]|uniref:DUF998 domain-containing protein n=1 Tax=Agromyces seonyuensis TaxID=2662446 RepID=A0A6I4NZ41_9MICO|nr:hypothetical protein [Agromyces seonyuensis]MWB97019.1 hypothetical protein [Agromyces seonyuensis]